nr:vinorine synthase-like [Ipomoea batatas]
MLAVQLNRFRCGGTAVAFCIWHGLADAGAMIGLFNTLAAINRGEGPINPGGLIVDASAIFRPGNLVSSPVMHLKNQVNRFRCGGTGVAFCIWHGVADGGGLMGLFNTLAAINRGEGPINPGGLVVDASAIFRPGNLVRSPLMPHSLNNQGNYSSKRFVFSNTQNSKIYARCSRLIPTQMLLTPPCQC